MAAGYFRKGGRNLISDDQTSTSFQPKSSGASSGRSGRVLANPVEDGRRLVKLSTRGCQPAAIEMTIMPEVHATAHMRGCES